MALNDVPLPGQTLGVTQNPIRANFLSINNAFAVDHIVYNLANAGRHNKVTFALQAAAPVFGALNGLWSQVYTTTGIAEVWINSLNGNQYPLSASILSTNPAIGNNTTGWTYLASGIVMKWGRVQVNGPTIVNLNAIGPAFAATFNAQATPIAVATAVNISALVPAALTLTTSVFGTFVYWFIIGRE